MIFFWGERGGGLIFEFLGGPISDIWSRSNYRRIIFFLDFELHPSSFFPEATIKVYIPGPWAAGGWIAHSEAPPSASGRWERMFCLGSVGAGKPWDPLFLLLTCYGVIYLNVSAIKKRHDVFKGNVFKRISITAPIFRSTPCHGRLLGKISHSFPL